MRKVQRKEGAIRGRAKSQEKERESEEEEEDEEEEEQDEEEEVSREADGLRDTNGRLNERMDNLLVKIRLLSTRGLFVLM